MNDFTPEGSRSESALDPIRDYFQLLKSLLTRPTEFFRSPRLDSSLSKPLALALVSHWVGSALSFLWGGFTINTALDALKVQIQLLQDSNSNLDLEQWQWIEEGVSGAQAWVMGAGQVILDPFLTLFNLALSALFVWLALKLLVPSTIQGTTPLASVSYRNSLRLVSYATIPSLLLAVPFFGELISWIYYIVLLMIGSQQVYQLSTGRSFVVAFSKPLFFLFVGLFIGGVVLLLLALGGLFFAALFQ